MRVDLPPIPALFVGDSFRVRARVLGPDGTPIAPAVLRYTTTSRFTVAADSTGLLRAVAIGQVELTVTAIAFAGAVATQVVRVHAPLEIDSVRPLEAPFGGLLRLYGVGLEPTPTMGVMIDGVSAPLDSYRATDPSAPSQGGVLAVFVPAPAGPNAQVIAVAGGSGALGGTITVLQRSLYEPNETAPAGLGILPAGGFANPALAFTRDRGRSWYTFENPAAQDLTISLRVLDLEPGTWSLLVTDVLTWAGGGACDHGSFEGYCVSGRACVEASGAPIPVDLRPQRSDSLAVALRRLPAGIYHVLLTTFGSIFGQPRSYQLAIRPGYASVLPPDAYEDNSACERAAPIVIPEDPGEIVLDLTRDGPFDRDWFAFDVGPAGDAVRITMRNPLPSPGAPDPTLALFRDHRPDSLARVSPTSFIVDDVTTSTMTRSVYNLGPGRYLLQVSGDERAVPYTLGATRFPGARVSAPTGP